MPAHPKHLFAPTVQQPAMQVISPLALADQWENTPPRTEKNTKDIPLFHSEDEVLQRINAVFPLCSEHVPRGRGDDCAELCIQSPSLALSTDVFIENQHFRRRYFTPYEVGYKSLTQAVSDLAAAGATPLGFSLALMLPATLPLHTLDQLLHGMSQAANIYTIALTGGDISCSPTLSLAITVWGESLHPKLPVFMQRGTAKPGDILFVAGAAGLAYVGLHVLEKHGRSYAEQYPNACAAHLLPTARIAEGLRIMHFASTHKLEKRMSLLDISDGITQDLPRLIKPYGATLDFAPHVMHPEIFHYATQTGMKPEEVFLQGGEDYSLLGTVPASHFELLTQSLPLCQRLGTVTQENTITLHGNRYSSKGFDHFQKKGSTPVCENTHKDAEINLCADHPTIAAGIQRIITLCQQGWQKGTLSGFNGNVSLRLNAPAQNSSKNCEYMLITASGVAKGFITPHDVVLLSLDGKHLFGPPASTESPLHLAIYKNNPNTTAILHTHPPQMLAVCLAFPQPERLNLPLFEAQTYLKKLRWVEKHMPGTPELAHAAGELSVQAPALWLENHGLIVHGTTLPACFALTEELEQLANIQLLSHHNKKTNHEKY